MSVQKNLCYTYWPPVGGPTACPQNRGACNRGAYNRGAYNRGAYNRGAHIWKRLGCV